MGILKIFILCMGCLSLIFFSQLIFQSTLAQTSSNYKTYENHDMGIKLFYPSNWQTTETIPIKQGCLESWGCSIGLSMEKDSIPFLSIFGVSENSDMQKDCKCTTLMDFVRYMYKKVQGDAGFFFTNDNQTTVGKKYPAWQFEYSTIFRNQSVTQLQVLTKVNNTFYRIIYFPLIDNQLYPKHLPEVKRIIDSVEFLPVQEPVTKIPSFMTANESSLLQNKSVSSNTLRILSHNSYISSIGSMHIVGEVRNDSPFTAEFVKIIGTFYDNNNNVVGTDFTYTEPYTIGAGNTAPFDLLLTSGSASIPVGQISSYKLSLSWQ